MFYKFISTYKFIFIYIIYLYVLYIYDQKNFFKDKHLKHDYSRIAVNIWVSEIE